MVLVSYNHCKRQECNVYIKKGWSFSLGMSAEFNSNKTNTFLKIFISSEIKERSYQNYLLGTITGYTIAFWFSCYFWMCLPR